jgi:fructoselysine 6-phosphate deglycase
VTTTTATTAPAQVEPIPSDLVDGVRAALGLAAEIDAYVKDCVDGGIRNVYFLGVGGSLLAHYPAQFLLETHATGVASHLAQAAEFETARPAGFGADALVVSASFTGTTPETVAAARTARNAGARVAAITKDADSPLAHAAEQTFLHTNVEGKQVLLGLIAWAVLRHTGAAAVDAAAVDAAYAAYPEALRTTLEGVDARLAEIAAALKDEPVTYVLGAGPNYGPAASLAMCYLQEMQWLDAAAINAGEFFHGAFEVVTETTPVILLLGEDATRPMAERAQRFLDTYTKKAVHLDSRDFSLPGVPAELRGYFTPAVFYSVAGRLAAHYAAIRGHDLKTRRYMFKVEY